MNRRFQTVLAVWCGMSLVGAGLGCEDPDARSRAEVQQQITDARAQFQRASLGSTDPGDDHAQQARSELNRVVSDLQGITQGEPGQQAAKSLLMAEALRELSLIEFRFIQENENHYQVERQMLHNRLLGLQRLAATRQAREQISAERQRTELNQIRRVTDEQLRQLQQQLARISEPIDELTTHNERDMERVDELREQATVKIRRSEELGPADGFELFTEAVHLHREADLIEFRMAQRELELLLEHRPVRQMTERSRQAALDLKEQVQAAIRDLDSFDQRYTSAASNLRSRIEDSRNELRTHVMRISEAMTGDLTTAYEAAIQHLDRAAAQARQAATRVRGEESNTARLIEARAYESTGRLHWQQASGVADHLALLSAIVAAPQAAGDTQPYESKIRQFAAQHETLLESAKAAHRQAVESLNMITGAGAQQVDAYRENIEMVISAMQGEQVDAWRRDAPATADTRPAAEQPRIAPTGDGFDSVDELVSFLRTMDQNKTDDVRRFASLMHAETRLGRAYVNMMNSLTMSMAELMAAVEETFGGEAVRQISQAAGGAGFTNLSLVEQTDTTATLRFQPLPSLPDGTMELVNIEGSWFINGDALGQDEMDDPQMAEFGIEAIEQMASAMSQQINSLTNRVRNGEFASIDQFMQAMMQAMMQGMGGMD